MPDSLEAAALNGSLFTFQDTPPSPTRSASTSSPQNTDNELDSDLDLEDGGQATGQSSRLGRRGDTKGRGAPRVRSPPVEHDGPQTGPKGVIEDRRAANTHAKQERDRQVAGQLAEANRRALVGLTIDEEDELRRKEHQGNNDDEELVEWRRRRKAQLAGAHDDDDDDWGHHGEKLAQLDTGRRESIKRGGLRELGAEGFVDAVEKPGWVAVLIYEPGIPRCTSLLASMLHLSLNLPSSLSIPITLYRALASSLSFSLLPPTSQTHATTTSSYHDDDDEDVPKGKPDPDVLPTMLVYKDGELEHNWVRVDWDVKEDGIEGLFRRVGILPSLHRTGINRQPQYLLDADDDD
ncbi:hypothetical protein IAT40_002939 [Kwoniella sp. CBS 6097]